jgi:hypothetical protein
MNDQNTYSRINHPETYANKETDFSDQQSAQKRPASRTKRSSGGKYQAKRTQYCQQAKFTPKWYLSVPAILLSVFAYPTSLVLTVLRVMSFKKQHPAYRRNTIFMIGIQLLILLLIMFTAVTSINWDNSFENAVSAGDYDTAYSLLEEKYGSDMNAGGIEYYFRVFELSEDYSLADDILEQYYTGLSDKTKFDSTVRILYQEAKEKMSADVYEQVQRIFSLVDDAIRLKAEAETSAAVKQTETEEPVQAQEEETENTLTESIEETDETTLPEIEEDHSAQLTQVKKAVDNYLEKNSAKNLKKIAKLDKTLVEEYLSELISGYLVHNPKDGDDAKRLCDKIETLYDIYLSAFSENSPRLSAIHNLAQDLATEYEQLDSINSRYPFHIAKANSCNWQEFYITQRLETSYSDNILGAIQKEIDSYTRDTTSNWVAYNVEYLPMIGATRGDTVTIIHAGELNPFPQAGVYNLLCYFGNETTSLTDGNGFVFDAPVVYMVSDDGKLYEDYNTYTVLQSSISVLENSINIWKQPASDAGSSSVGTGDTDLTIATAPTEAFCPIPSTQIEGYVIMGCGELNVRSGPGTQYEMVKRLREGTEVVVSETRVTGNTEWGYIGDGWVSMDYIAEGNPPAVAGNSVPQQIINRYVGHWGDFVSQRCMMNITYHKGVFSIELSWASSASSTSMWQFTGYYDRGSGSIQYANGRHYTVEVSDSGHMTETTHCTNGSGYFSLADDGYIYWEDYTENMGVNCIFEKTF